MRRDDVFARLDPPPEGLARLRRRLDDRRRALVLRLAPAVAALAAAAVLLIVLGRPRSPDLVSAARSLGNASEIQLGLAPLQADTVELSGGEAATTVLHEVASSNPQVAFYWISSTAWEE